MKVIQLKHPKARNIHQKRDKYIPAPQPQLIPHSIPIHLSRFLNLPHNHNYRNRHFHQNFQRKIKQKAIKILIIPSPNASRQPPALKLTKNPYNGGRTARCSYRKCCNDGTCTACEPRRSCKIYNNLANGSKQS